MKKAPVILVVDDDTGHRTMLRTLLKGWKYEIKEADDGKTAVESIEQGPYDLVLMDIRMVNISGMEALDRIKFMNPSIPVILMTAYSSVETAVDALKKGAYDYLTKPLDFEKLKITIQRAMEHTQLKKENRLLKETLGKHFDHHNIIGKSPVINRLMETVSLVAPSEATVLITGESGTGKELIAGAIHFNSLRKANPFIKINCAAITETLLESELFGHEKGAFTGASRKKEGKFELADTGSLFLDEVSEMSHSMQAKLLRVLQEREITRVGGEKVISVDVRVIAATHRNLKKLVFENRFRKDLYYRLNVVNLEIASLKKRREDIPLLAHHFLKHFTQKNRKTIKGFTPRCMDRMIRYQWPGNVRELMNAVERGVVLARSEYIDTKELPVAVMEQESDIHINPGGPSTVDTTIKPLDEMEKEVILKTMNACDGNKSEAARRLGITRKTLHKKLKKYG